MRNSWTACIISAALFAVATLGQAAPLQVEEHPPPVGAVAVTRWPPERTPAPEVEEYITTGYCWCEKCCGRWAYYHGGGWTASGTRATAGRTVAVDPEIIPLGTRVWVEGLGVLVAEDTGSAVRGRHIDVFFDTHAEAAEFGVQRRRVVVLND